MLVSNVWTAIRLWLQKFGPNWNPNGSAKARDSQPLSAETADVGPTFVMKRPFGFKGASKFLSGAFGQCSSDEDKVQLISVFSQHAAEFSNEEDSDTLSSCSSHSNQRDSESECEKTKEEPAAGKTGTEESTPCDPVASTCEVLRHHVTEQGFVQREDATFGTASGPDNLEWIFTLYDFDGSGKVTKEDIVTLVRSIYEVLESAKIPKYSNSASEENGKKVKVKLSVVASDESVCKPLDVPPIPVAVNIGEKPEKKFTIAGKRRSQNSLESGRSRHSQGNFSVDYSRNCAQDRDTSKRPRKHSAGKPLSPKNHPEELIGGSSRGPPTVPLRFHKPKQTHFFPQTRTAGQRCVSCSNYRDYVNLSELENCCTHHHQTQYPGIHHVRHCDRHCSCSKYPETKGKPEKRPESGDYAKLIFAPEQCCRKEMMRPSTSVKTNVLQNLSNTNRARNMAYYSQRTGTQQTDKAKDGSGGKENGIPKSAETEGSFPEKSFHERKHQNRQREKLRAMQQVKEWILKESAESAAPRNSKPTISEGTNGLIVEHRHIHEHHHYVHQQ